MSERFAFVERGELTWADDFSEIVAVTPAVFTEANQEPSSIRIRIEDAPQDTVAPNLETAAVLAAAMLDLSRSKGALRFRVEYHA